MNIQNISNSVTGSMLKIQPQLPHRLPTQNIKIQSRASMEELCMGQMKISPTHGCIEMLFLIGQFTHGKSTGGIGSSFQIMSTSIHQKKTLRLNRYITLLGSRIMDNGSMTSISTDRRKALLHIVFLLCPSCLQIICR